MGLAWLNGARYESVPFCLTFVRGLTEGEVFARFGADSEAAVPSVGADPDGPPLLRVARRGKWLVAIEMNIPPQGVRPEMLRQLSAGADAVAVYQDIGKLNHEMAYAADGDVVAAVVTAVPPKWSGTNPGLLADPASDLGVADGGPPDLEILLSIAERVFGLSLDEDFWDRPWPAAPILPHLDDLPSPPPRSGPPSVHDPVVDLYLAHLTTEALVTVLRIRADRLISEVGLGRYPELVTAVERSLAEGSQPETGDLAKTLRRLARAQSKAEMDLAVRRADLPAPEEEVRAQVRAGQAAEVLRCILSGRLEQALMLEFIRQQRSWNPQTWHDQAVADLAQTIEVPNDELESAERTWQATKHLPHPFGIAAVGPVRQHVQRLLDAGWSRERISEVTGVGPYALDVIMSGKLREMGGSDARKIMLLTESGD